MALIEILPGDNILIELAYATANNFTKKPVYSEAHCYLHQDAMPYFEKACRQAKSLGYTIKIWDAFRPAEANQVLWDAFPDPRYVGHPSQGSSHNRGLAIDLTLVDSNGCELDMGTPFDHFDETAHQGCLTVPQIAQKNRLLLAGIMASTGWEIYPYEWWHYHMPNFRDYPLLIDKDAPRPLMSK